MKRDVLFWEGRSGISGDMAVAALLELGGSREKLERGLASLALPGVSWKIGRRQVGGIAAGDFRVLLEGHDDTHHEHAEPHHHEHRTLAEIEAILDRGDLAPGARARTVPRGACGKRPRRERPRRIWRAFRRRPSRRGNARPSR